MLTRRCWPSALVNRPRFNRKGLVTRISQRMRLIGRKAIAQPGLVPTASNLAMAQIHQRTGQALAANATTGIPKGIYQFATHEQMNRHSDEALARAIAANLRWRALPRPRKRPPIKQQALPVDIPRMRTA